MFRKLSLTGIFFAFSSFKSSLPSSMRSARDIFLTSINRFFLVKPAYCIHAALMLDGQYYSVANYYLNWGQILPPIKDLLFCITLENIFLALTLKKHFDILLCSFTELTMFHNSFINQFFQQFFLIRCCTTYKCINISRQR